jgi:NAD+ kinase
MPLPQLAPWLTESRRPRLLLLGSGERPSVLPEAERLRPILEKHADVVRADFEFTQDLSTIRADLAVVLGGDGSILRAANQMRFNQTPVLGVNLGKLGFLADLSPAELIAVFPEVCAGTFRVAEHLMFHTTVRRKGELLCERLGLNETSILGGPPFSILNIDLYVDAELATTYSCDGLIVSTPVGSTAHSLSAGGPILRKNLQAFVISPISPHTLTVRPVVDTADHIYEMVVSEPNEATSVVVDGRVLCRLTPNDRVRVERAEPTFKMVEVKGHSYYRTLREKLGWGGTIIR